MPKYDYSCKQCNTSTEQIRKVADRDKPVNCDKCNRKMERVPSVTSPPIFAGSGWTPKHY